MIWASHGVVDGYDAELFVHRNLFDRTAFARHLAERTEPYVDVERAAAGEGEALTIDDATLCGAQAARMAAEAGHAVTLFVNPEQVEHGSPYHFALLNAVFDRISCPSLRVAGRELPTATLAQRQKARKRIKSWVGGAHGVAQRHDRVLAVAAAAGIDDVQAPAHLQTLSGEDLHELADAGVSIGNHGWSHASYFAFSKPEVVEQVRRGREWLRSRLGRDAHLFAVPYGELLPPEEASTDWSLWLLNTDMFRHGRMKGAIFNRPTLRLT